MGETEPVRGTYPHLTALRQAGAVSKPGAAIPASTTQSNRGC
jgi:hypothetical protein